MGNLFCFYIFIGKKTLICLYGVFLDVAKCTYSELRAESEKIVISKVELLVSGTVRVDICIYQWYSEGELAHRRFNGCKCGIVHAGRVCGCIAAVNCDSEMLVEIP